VIVVFGSINMDLVVRTPRLPAPGESLRGRTFFTAPGGKGANQAVAIGRLGAPVRMIGQVGADVFGGALRDSLQASGIDIAHVTVMDDAPSGVAVIAVDDRAENSIIVAAGANDAITDSTMRSLDSALDGAHLLLMQLEVPMERVIQAAEAARQRKIRLILDPAPVVDIPSALYSLVDIITPNETEVVGLLGFRVATLDDAHHAAALLLERGVREAAIIKMGGQGAYLLTCAGDSAFVPAYQVAAVDTVAAGDAFNGGLAVALAEGKSLLDAVRFGAATAAISVTRSGAQASMPTRHEVELFLSSRR
jgi:ribokinase